MSRRRSSPASARMGSVEFTIRYTVDLNNPQMVAHAKDAIMDDLTNIADNVLPGLIDTYQNDTLRYEDIPAFLREDR